MKLKPLVLAIVIVALLLSACGRPLVIITTATPSSTATLTASVTGSATPTASRTPRPSLTPIPPLAVIYEVPNEYLWAAEDISVLDGPDGNNIGVLNKGQLYLTQQTIKGMYRIVYIIVNKNGTLVAVAGLADADGFTEVDPNAPTATATQPTATKTVRPITATPTASKTPTVSATARLATATPTASPLTIHGVDVDPDKILRDSDGSGNGTALVGLRISGGVLPYEFFVDDKAVVFMDSGPAVNYPGQTYFNVPVVRRCGGTATFTITVKDGDETIVSQKVSITSFACGTP